MPRNLLNDRRLWPHDSSTETETKTSEWITSWSYTHILHLNRKYTS